MKQKNSFYEKCYEILKKVPKGKVTTYKEIAHALGSYAYRAVGSAMNKNPYAPQVACHRVVNSDGKIGGFAVNSNGHRSVYLKTLNAEAKIKMLKKERIHVKNWRIVDFEKVLYKF